MSLITRCPNCSTMFKIVPDQLRISEGWVRCGHCSDIFDASLHLQSQEDVARAADAVAPLLPPGAAGDGVSALPFPSEDACAPAAPESPSGGSTAAPPSVWLRRSGASALLRGDSGGSDDAFHALSGSSTAWQETRQDAYDATPDAPFEDDNDNHTASTRGPSATPVGKPPTAGPLARPLMTEDVPSALLLQTADSDVTQSPLYDSVFAVPAAPMAGTAEAGVDADPEDAKLLELDFVRIAERKAFWRSPAIVAVSVVACAVLLLVLLAQAAVQERDRLAASVPALQPVLAALCIPVSCQVGPRRQIEAIAIEGSAFNKTRGNLYQLSIDLRSTATTALAMPALELTLTDTDGQPLVRRVLEPVDLRAPQLLQPQGAWSGTLPMRLQDPAVASRIAGYGLLAFYP